METSRWSDSTTFCPVVYRDILSSWKVSWAFACHLQLSLNVVNPLQFLRTPDRTSLGTNEDKPRGLSASWRLFGQQWIQTDSSVYSKSPQGPNTMQQISASREAIQQKMNVGQCPANVCKQQSGQKCLYIFSTALERSWALDVNQNFGFGSSLFMLVSRIPVQRVW